MGIPGEAIPLQKKGNYRNPSYQAYLLLCVAFTLASILAGLDKYFYVLTNWEKYLSPTFNVLGNSHTTMMAVGAIEVIVGIGVWLKPKIFAYLVALWLFAIIINLLTIHFYDIALRDFGLLLGALALARLSVKYDH